MRETGPLPIDAAPTLIIPLRAAQSVTGWNSETGEPESRAFLWWEIERDEDRAKYDHLLIDRTKHDQAYFICPELDTMNPMNTPRIVARYEPPGGAAIKLMVKFVGESVDFIKSDAGAGWLYGTIHNNTTPTIMGDYLLYVTKAKHEDWTDKIPLGTQEEFVPDATFIAGPLKIVDWDYESDTRDGTHNRKTGLPSPDGFTIPDSLLSGQEQLVVANLDVETYKVTLLKPHFQVPSGWPQPVFAGTAGFNLGDMDYNHTGNRIDDYYKSVEISPVTDPATTLAEARSVRGASAPGLHVSSTSGNYIFAGWDTTGGTMPNLFVNAFSWAGGTATWPTGVWPATMTGDRQARPIYTIRHPLTLSITPVDATDKHFFYLEASPYGIEVSNAGGITTSETKSYAQGSQFTLKATSTDPGPYHVVKSWIIRKDVNGDGTYSQETVIVADNGADNLPGDKTYELTLDYPTKSEVVFGWQQFEIKLDVANSKDGARHGDVKLDGNLLTPRESLPLGKLVNYGTTLDIEALADTGYLFKGWTPVEDGPASPAQAATTVFVNKAKTLTAHFERKVTLILATDPADLPAQVISPEAGTWTELPAGTILTDGVIVSGIQALVGTGYDFTHWTIVDGNNPDPANPRTVDTATLGDLELYGDAEAKITATAHYVRLYDLTINAQGLDADGAEESKVQANPSLSIDNQPMVAIANSNPTVTGQYREYLEGETYAPPRTITLTPTAGAHYEFDHWEITQGGTPLILTPAAGTNTVTLPSFTGNTVATAFFKKKNYTLTVSAWKADNVPFPPGSDGNIASLLRTTTPVTQNFPLDGATGTLSVPYKSKVTLTTSPAPRFSFDKWTDSGANDLGSDPQTPAGYAFTLIGDRTLRAEFTREEFQLTTAVTPDNSYGTITSSVIRLTNPTWHIADTVLTLTAVPAVVSPGITSYLFSEWTTTRNNVAETPGAPASTTLELKMDADWTATARFVKAVRVKVDVSATSAAPGTPGGSITGITGYKHQDPDGYYVFAEGDPVTITAAANEHFTFSEWTGAPADAIRTDTGNPATRSKLEFTASADAEITAKFTAKTYTLTVTSDPAAAARTLVAHQPPAPDHNFLTDGADISRLYPTVLSLETTPAGANNGDPSPHYRFISWREGASMLNTSPTLPFTFNRNADIQAFFIRQVIVTMNPVLDITRATEISGTGGTVSLPVGDHRKDVPDTIIITATPGVGYEFAEWRGLPAGATVDPVTGTLTLPLTETTGDLELTPCFRLVFHKVTISTWDKYTSVANVSGSVMISPDPEPNGRYYYGTKVTVTLRQTYYGYRFLGWDANGDRDPEVTVFNDPVTCSATFTVTDTMEIVGIFHRTFRLSMNTDPTSGSGTAAITSPPPISQVTPGTWVFDAGTRVNLLAEPVVPAEFIGWAGDVDNPDAETTSVMMTADRSITARFGVQIRRNLTVNVTPATHGTVLIDDSLIVGGACPPTATKSYIHGQEADLKATALAGYEFAGWTGDPVIGSAAVTHARVAMTAARALTANFRIVRHELTVRALPDGSGTVTGGGFYDNNQTATLTASPASGYTFRGWDTDGNGTPDETSTTLSVVVTGDRTIDALFRKIGENATLTVQVSPSGSASYSILDGDVPNEKIIRVSPAASYTWPEHLAWSGPDSGLLYGHSLDEDTGVLEARIYLTSDRSVAISLVPIAVTLTVEAVPSDKGVVTIDPPGGSYTKGSKVTVDAIATDPGFIFKHWEGPVTSDSSVLRVTLDTSMKLVAIFEMKPKTYQVTLGFDSMSVDHDNDQVELRSTGSLLFKDRNSQQLSGFFLEGSELTIRCLLEDYLNYGFSSWTGVPNENVQYTDPDSQGNVTSHLLVTQGMTVNALVQVENPLLRTYATCEADDSQNKDPCVSVGGTVTPGGFCSIGDRMLIWAVPNPGWMVIPGPPPLATSGWGSSYISAEQPDPTGQPEGAVGFYVIIGAKVTDVPVPFVPDGYVPPKVSISGGSHELDNPDTRAPRHHIYGTPLSP
jgi:hypothetical protein